MPSLHIPGFWGAITSHKVCFDIKTTRRNVFAGAETLLKRFFWVFSMAIQNSQSGILKISDCNLCMQRPLLCLSRFELYSQSIWNLLTKIHFLLPQNFRIGKENGNRPSPSMKLYKLISITFSGRCPTVMKIPYTFYRYLTSSKYRQCHAV